MSRWARPARPVAPMAVAVTIVVLWWLVAHNAGAGWVQLLGDLVFGVLLIGIVGPSLVVTRATLEVIGAPADAVAGMGVDVLVKASTRLRIRPVGPSGPEVFVGPVGRRGSVGECVTVVPERRGVYAAVTLDIASAAPFALQWWSRPRAARAPVRAARVAPVRAPGAAPLEPARGGRRGGRSAADRHGLPTGCTPLRRG